MTKYWSETQHLAARWFAERGWPLARAVGNGRSGVDIENMAGLAPEVKSGVTVQPTLWLRQAAERDGVPFVIYRPKGYGPGRIATWPVIVDLSTFTALLAAAGYGDGES